MTIPPHAGYVALFAIVFLAEAGVPLLAPTELVLVAAGIAAANGDASLSAVVALALTADLLGTSALFGLVRLGGERLGGRLGRLVDSARRKAHTLGALDFTRVAAARSVPLLRIPATAAAGLAGLSLRRFAVAALIGGTVWVALFVGAGYVLTRESLHVF